MTAAQRAARAVFARKSAQSSAQSGFQREMDARASRDSFATRAKPSFRPAYKKTVQETIEGEVIGRGFDRQEKPTVIFTLDRDGNPEWPSRRGGYFPYLTSGQLRLARDPGMLIDFHV